MEVQMTAPYSPSQNGVAERMNRTLVELAHAMITGSGLPEFFLWEHAVAHATYIRNWSFTTAIGDKTPYEAWYGSKPNIAHLWEFRTPVWILLQGQNVVCKILLKSKRRSYVGNNDVSKSVLYYNADTRKVLTLHNYVFLTAQKPEPPEAIIVKQAPLLEGEHGGVPERDVEENAPNVPNAGRKHKEFPPAEEPWHMRGIQKDYQKMADPFSNNDNDEYNNVDLDEFDPNLMFVMMAEVGDEFQSLKQARESPIGQSGKSQ